MEAAPLSLASWSRWLSIPHAEPTRSRRLAHVGALAAVAALVAYLTWRIFFTLPSGGWNRTVAWVLVAFEALPLAGLVLKVMTLWNIDSRAPGPAGPGSAVADQRVVVLIPTYNE